MRPVVHSATQDPEAQRNISMRTFPARVKGGVNGGIVTAAIVSHESPGWHLHPRRRARPRPGTA